MHLHLLFCILSSCAVKQQTRKREDEAIQTPPGSCRIRFALVHLLVLPSAIRRLIRSTYLYPGCASVHSQDIDWILAMKVRCVAAWPAQCLSSVLVPSKSSKFLPLSANSVLALTLTQKSENSAVSILGNFSIA